MANDLSDQLMSVSLPRDQICNDDVVMALGQIPSNMNSRIDCSVPQFARIVQSVMGLLAVFSVVVTTFFPVFLALSFIL